MCSLCREPYPNAETSVAEFRKPSVGITPSFPILLTAITTGFVTNLLPAVPAANTNSAPLPYLPCKTTHTKLVYVYFLSIKEIVISSLVKEHYNVSYSKLYNMHILVYYSMMNLLH